MRNQVQFYNTNIAPLWTHQPDQPSRNPRDLASDCAHTKINSFPASSINGVNKPLDASLKAVAGRLQSYLFLILDARYEKVREAGVIVSQAVLVAVAVDEDGRRQILGV